MLGRRSSGLRRLSLTPGGSNSPLSAGAMSDSPGSLSRRPASSRRSTLTPHAEKGMSHGAGSQHSRHGSLDSPAVASPAAALLSPQTMCTPDSRRSLRRVNSDSELVVGDDEIEVKFMYVCACPLPSDCPAVAPCALTSTCHPGTS